MKLYLLHTFVFTDGFLRMFLFLGDVCLFARGLEYLSSLIHKHMKESLSSASPLPLLHTILHRLSSPTTDRVEMESTEERNSERRRRRKGREEKRVRIQGTD